MNDWREWRLAHNYTKGNVARNEQATKNSALDLEVGRLMALDQVKQSIHEEPDK
jgi:hypothetical protein